ncbi:30S ribosomal protein S9 [Thermosipho ferrireducens]|uniref:Small ribosomal subunit protein uS9 n=1 Tax=Thermosipho ferrireducens TaxID=2571116 RepID=A0ABX7S450_9BACT|nr:30S ribosomal protein S9 [Thermosipho ferrireducens]QTA37152.1 30S ribosomal protein S9 [Thermosipho ferrireducens]
MANYYYGTGRRKTSVARVYLKEGNGKVIVNDKEYEDLNGYLNNSVWTLHAMEPLKVVGLEGKFDMVIRVSGGGKSGQSGAIRLGIARALLQYDAELKVKLKEKGLLTRDPRMVERKKYGLRKARRAPQFSKR